MPCLPQRHDRPGISSYQETSSSESPNSSTSPDSQPQTKDPLQRELATATFRVDLTANGSIFYADPNHVQSVLDRLQRQHNLTSSTLFDGGISSETSLQFPRGFSKEDDSYEPLVCLLNTIICATNECLPPAQRYLKNLRFCTYGREVIQKYGSFKPLKPDCLGLLHDLPKEEKASWEEIEVTIEAKGETKGLVKQAATYARCSLVNDGRRFFATAIGFNYKSMEVYFFLFHRSGLSSSHPLSLKEPQGFQAVVTHIVGMLTIRDEASYRLDATRSRSGDIFRINDRYYDVVQPLYMRDSLRGRATVVYNLKARTTDPPVPGLESRMLRLANDTLPDQITYKLSYLVDGHAREGQLLSPFMGQFGIADVIGFHVCGHQEPHGSTLSLFHSPEFWNIFDGKDGKLENRSQQCIAMSSGGRSLLDLDDEEEGIPKPGELLETILHAIIGHCNLFFGGVLHRDISNGNVLRHRQPVERPALDMFQCTKDVDMCRGSLIDGDHAIEWQTIPQSRMDERSGTFPFVSFRLLFAWIHRAPIMQTPIDDLESFLWLLVWTVVYILANTGNAASYIVDLRKIFSSNSLETGMLKYEYVRSLWEDVVFRDLIQDWLAILDQARMAVEPHARAVARTPEESSDREIACDMLKAQCKGVYEDVLKVGYSHLETIGQYSDWNQVVEANASYSKSR